MRSKYLTVLLCIIALGGIATEDAATDEPLEHKSNDVNPMEQVDVFYLTLRNKTEGKFSTQYYGGQRDQLRAGICSLEFKSIWGLTDIADALPFYIPDESKKLANVSDIRQFLSYFIAAVQTFFPDIDNETQALLNADEDQIWVFGLRARLTY